MTASGRVQLVLLDLDGTLVDHGGAAATALQTWLVGSGWASAGEAPALAVRWEEVAEQHFTEYRAGRVGFQEQRRRRLREYLPGLGVDAAGWSDERLDAVFAGYERAYRDAWRAYDDALPCLRALQALPGSVALAVLSNGDRQQQEAKTALTGLRAHLAAVLTSGELGVAEPDPRAFAAACSRLGAAPERTVHVGDRLDVDALGAAAAGLRGVWLDRSGAGPPPGARSEVTRIRSLTELPPLLTQEQPCSSPT